MRQAELAGDTEFIAQYGDGPVTIELPEEYSIYATAYIMLDRDRYEYTGHIPWSKFVDYGIFYQFTRDQIDWLVEIGFRVDNVIVAERIRKAKLGGNS